MTVRAYVGIDPGLTGALAVVVTGGPETEARVWDTPTAKVSRGYEYLVASMHELLQLPEGAEIVAAVEQGIAMPRQSSSSTFKTGRGIGLWEGLLAGMGIPYEMVTVHRWKAALGIAKGADKATSRVLAQRLFPQLADQFARVKDDGRAEAILIALWLRRQYESNTILSGDADTPPSSG